VLKISIGARCLVFSSGTRGCCCHVVVAVAVVIVVVVVDLDSVSRSRGYILTRRA
jgi:hypothetical protein